MSQKRSFLQQLKAENLSPNRHACYTSPK